MSIYLQHFALDCEPFSIVPDPGFLYPSNQHRQAVAHLKYGLDREGGFVLLTGEVGTGKTTLTRTLLKRLPAHVRVAYVLNSTLEVTDVLASICQELSIDLPKSSKTSLSKNCIDALNSDLIAAHAEGKKTLVVIEEAQNLSPEVLEILRLLSNLETATHKLLHILLVGQPELLETLAQKDQRQLNQRVVARFHLLPLAKTDVANYVNHRLHHAGAKRAIFDNAAMGTLFRLTKGVPRLINLICHHSLLAAYANSAQTVSAGLVKKAAAEILQTELPKPKTAYKWLMPGLLSALVVCLGLLLYREYLVIPMDEPVVAMTPSIEIVEPAIAEKPVAVIEPVVPAVSLVPEVIPQAQVVMSADRPEPAKVHNPFAALFAIWSVEVGPLFSEEEVYALADANGLSAEKLTDTDLATLITVDRPGIVWIKDDSQHVKIHLLAAISDDNVSLVGLSGERSESIEWFANHWSGAFLYLWHWPSDIRTLRLGDSDPVALDWLQARLQQLDTDYERVITGGRYNAAIREQVLLLQTQQGITADGVVGRQTIMRLNQLTNQSTPRLIKQQQSEGVN